MVLEKRGKNQVRPGQLGPFVCPSEEGRAWNQGPGLSGFGQRQEGNRADTTDPALAPHLCSISLRP